MGVTASQVQRALKVDNPYPARIFLKLDESQADIPVFFRIKETPTYEGFIKPRAGNCENWIRPKIKKGSYLQVEGYFSIGTVYIKQSERKSFTAISYQILNSRLNQEILGHGK